MPIQTPRQHGIDIVTDAQLCRVLNKSDRFLTHCTSGGGSGERKGQEGSRRLAQRASVSHAQMTSRPAKKSILSKQAAERECQSLDLGTANKSKQREATNTLTFVELNALRWINKLPQLLGHEKDEGVSTHSVGFFLSSEKKCCA